LDFFNQESFFVPKIFTVGKGKHNLLGETVFLTM